MAPLGKSVRPGFRTPGPYLPARRTV